MRLFLAFALVAAACSGGGGGGVIAPPGGDVSILTQTIDQGNVGHNFFQQLQAGGGQQPYTWWVSTSGDALPNGMMLQPDGRLAGTPTLSGLRSVVFVVQDVQSRLDLVTMPLEVRDVEITPGQTANLVPGAQLAFAASGGQGFYDFSLMANQSGGGITTAGAYTAGFTSGVDVVRATDQDGFYEEVTLTVGDDPFVGFQADYGSTDVWWINWDVVYDPSPVFASDLDAALATLGLRHPSSTDTAGTEADQLARLLVIRRALGHLSTYYGNGADGVALGSGLSISFVGPDAPSVGSTPTIGDQDGASALRYNTICARWGPGTAVVGTAWTDTGNTRIEHNCGDPQSTALGVFANRIVASYMNGIGKSIASNPVGASDVAALRTMLYGAAPQNGREQDIYDVADDYGRVFAAVLAHEIGHSLGLGHSGDPGEPSSSGAADIMNSALTVGNSIFYAFNATHVARLNSDLPGPNR